MKEKNRRLLSKRNFEAYRDFVNNNHRQPSKEDCFDDGLDIYYWAKRQKQAYSRGQLPEKTVQRLQNIGFDFTYQRREEIWYIRLKQYIAYKENAHKEPNLNDEWDGVKIGIWVASQRKLYANHKLSSQQVELLKKAGFVFSLRRSKLDQRLKLYREFVKKYHREPTISEIYKGVQLGKWLSVQRKSAADGKLSAERKTKLEKNGVFLGNKTIFRSIIKTK